MKTVEQLNQMFAEKLLATGSLDAAFKKATWVAYLQGVSDGAQHAAELQEQLETLKVELEALRQKQKSPDPARGQIGAGGIMLCGADNATRSVGR